MLNFWFKNRFIYILVTTITIALLSLFVVIIPSLNTNAENNLISSLYEKSSIDFDIPEPTKNQLLEIKSMDFIEEVFGYYYTQTDISYNSKNIKTKIILSDMLDAIDFTMYNDERLIKEDNGFENPIYIDYAFAKDNNISIGDHITLFNISFQVGRIYETNTYIGSSVFVPLVGDQKIYIENIYKSYSGAFLKASDYTRLNNYLKGYKPLGRLNSRSDYETEEQYQYHYNSWNNASYYNEITSLRELGEDIKTKNENSHLIGIVLNCIVLIILNIALSIRKSELLYFKKRRNKKNIFKFYFFNSIAEFILTVFLFICALFIAYHLTVEYIEISQILKIAFEIVIIAVIMLVINNIYNIILYKKNLVDNNNSKINYINRSHEEK